MEKLQKRREVRSGGIPGATMSWRPLITLRNEVRKEERRDRAKTKSYVAILCLHRKNKTKDKFQLYYIVQCKSNRHLGVEYNPGCS